MKIVHICLASHYTENMSYQDNIIPDINSNDGHDVIVVSDCLMYKEGVLVEVPEEDKVLNSGVRLIRVRLNHIINRAITARALKCDKVSRILLNERPDVILYHGVVGWEMLTVARYKKANPSVRLYIDCHEDFNNSGTVWYSLLLQYYIYNRFLVMLTKKYVDKYLYVSLESRDFLSKIYNFKEEIMEYYPLGGKIILPHEKFAIKNKISQKINSNSDEIIIVHSGKFGIEKRTFDLIKAFKAVECKKLKLILIGHFPEELSDKYFSEIQSDPRIKYMGWMSSSELFEYLCAADIYFQPGSQSATLQSAICCGCPIAVYPHSSHEPFMNNNGFYVENYTDCLEVLNIITSDPTILHKMSSASYDIAFKLLDYRKISSRLYR